MAFNVELANRVLEHIQSHMTKWNQGDWGVKTPDCGTAYCFGGWAVALTDGEGFFEWAKDEYIPRKRYLLNITEVRLRAMQLLGLNGDQADLLFSGGNDMDDIEVVLEGIKNGDDYETIATARDGRYT